MEKVYFFGGAFDPLHYGHIAIIIGVSRIVDKLFIVPSSNRWDKTSYLFDNNKRIKAIKKLIEILAIPNVYLDTSELESKVFRGTYKFLSSKREIFSNSEVGFVMGSDSIKHINKWKDPLTNEVNGYKLLNEFPLIIVSREHEDIRIPLSVNNKKLIQLGYPSDLIGRYREYFPDIEDIELFDNLSSSKIKEKNFKNKFCFKDIIDIYLEV